VAIAAEVSPYVTAAVLEGEAGRLSTDGKTVHVRVVPLEL
jgi:hypothetical protein